MIRVSVSFKLMYKSTCDTFSRPGLPVPASPILQTFRISSYSLHIDMQSAASKTCSLRLVNMWQGPRRARLQDPASEGCSWLPMMRTPTCFQPSQLKIDYAILCTGHWDPVEK